MVALFYGGLPHGLQDFIWFIQVVALLAPKEKEGAASFLVVGLVCQPAQSILALVGLG